MSGESSEPNLNLTPDEKRAYGQLFRQADGDGVGVVTGDVAVQFFDKTRLDSTILGEIWQIADKENRGFLTPAGFGVVLRLIGHAQAGRQPTAALSLQPGPLPRFDGITTTGGPGIAGPASPTQAQPIQAQGTGGAIRIPPLMPEKAAQYAGLFERQPLQNNMLPGDKAKDIFEKAGLPNQVLGRIWGLADTEQRGALVVTEFIIAMHLLTSMKTGALRSLPSVLPAPLYEAATRRGSASGPAPHQSPTNTGVSAIPRQLSGQAQMRTGSPLGRPPMAPQGTGAGSDWAVSQADKAKFDQIYAGLDKGNKGYITGDEAVPFLGQSGLPEEALAQVWDLSDIRSAGQLTRDEFAVAMYLIRQQRMKPDQPLPSSLPANLIPPSLRNVPRPGPAASAFEPPPAEKPAPPPQPKSALDDLFGLDTSTPAPAPTAPGSGPAPAPFQNTMSTGGSNANDPFAGGASNTQPTSPLKTSTTGTRFAPFVPSSSFGRGLSGQVTGDSAPEQANAQASASDDLLGADDGEASKNISSETTELANLSNQVSSLSKRMQDTQARRNITQNELKQSNSQKANFEQRLAQLRTLYEKEAEETRGLEEKLRSSRADTQRLRGECMTLEGTYRDVQTQHQELAAQLQADQQENANLREKIRVVNGEIAQLKPQIEKLKSDARQQKGLVAINKKQLSTTEGEREKLKTEADELAKGGEDVSRQISSASPAPAASQIASPALSATTANNPFFKRSASTDIMGAFAPPPRTATDQSVDDLFGPSAATPPPAAAAPFKAQITGTSTGSTPSMHTPPTTSPSMARATPVANDPPAPPESRQMSSSFLPFPEHTESLSSSRQVSPPASRAGGYGNDAENPFPGDFDSVEPSKAASEVAEDKTGTPGPTDVAVTAAPAPPTEAQTGAGAADPFTNADPGADDAKAKAEFDNAFAAFTSAKQQAGTPSNADAFKPPPAREFPPTNSLERDDYSESDSEAGGFDDDFAPPSLDSKDQAQASGSTDPFGQASATFAESAPSVPPKEPASSEQPSSPATITEGRQTEGQSSVNDIFGAAGSGEAPAAKAAAPSDPPAKGVFDDDDDDFEGLEDAKEGSADDDFAHVSRSGLDDFNTTFDSSPPASSQAKSESTAFGNDSSFDFAGAPPASGTTMAPPPQTAGDSHDWDAIFAGLDGSENNAAVPAVNEPAEAKEQKPVETRPDGPGRALTQSGEHDDPILKELTGMGYPRSDALAALEKYDYNLERAANYLASQS